MTDQPTEQLDLPGSWTCQGCGGGPIMGGQPPYCTGCSRTSTQQIPPVPMPPRYAPGWPEAPVRVPVTRARGGADWSQRIKAAVFVGAVMLDVLIAGVGYLFFRHVLWGHG